MRINNISLILLFCIIAALSLSSCLEITTTSQINRDGSIVRTITFTGDSAEVYAGHFPVTIDSTWSRSIAKVPGKEKHFTLTGSKTFRDVEEMNGALHGTFGRTLQYKFELEKSFQWFFTVYRYREANLPFEQFKSIPPTNFVSQEELSWLETNLMDVETQDLHLTKEDSLRLESITPRMQEYEWQNRFAPVFEAFLEGVKTINSSLLTTATVERMKDSLYRNSTKHLDERNVDTLRFVFARILRSPVVEKAWQANAPAFVEVKRRLEFEHTTNSHSYVTGVLMPGLITGSNATKIEGNKATWRDYKEHGRVFGFTMSVESRQVNWWAVIVAFAVVAALVIVLILSVVRARKRI